MKAILMTAYGGTDVLHVREIFPPELPTSNHVRVKLAAAGVNPVDTKVRAKPGYFPNMLPAILGCDGAGVVESVGSNVTRFKVGDEVYFCNGGLGDEPGCYAEYTTVHEDFCAAKPAGLTMVEAAALPLVLITAWESLVERTNLQPKQSVLIHAGAGGVGHVAIQLAHHHLGAHVASTVSSEAKAAVAHGYGSERTIRYREQEFAHEAVKWSYGQGVDVVFDTVGGETFLKSFNAVRLGGKVVSLLSTAMSQADAQLARMRNLTIAYDLMLTPQLLRLHDERVRQRKILEEGAKLVEAGKLRPLVSHTFPLDEVARAHELIERGGITGKVVLTI